jgi:aryl-alcohol dehydrogenase-like predicted oxidoreductase
MEYRILGKTGLKVSVLGIGSWQLSGAVVIDGQADGFPDIGRKQVITIIRGCGDLGINLIDTAEIYGDGEGERRIGAAIEGQRDRWILSSKFGMRRSDRGKRLVNCHPDTIRNSLEASLRRLNTDYLDLYLYHAPPQPEWIELGREVLETLKQEGKIRFYGISTDHASELQALVDHNAVDVVSCSQSLINQPHKILNLVKANNLGLLSRGALAAGQLSGKYFQRSPQLSQEDFRHNLKMNWNRYQFYTKFLPDGTSMVAFCLRYLLDFATTQTILIGGKSLTNYQEAIKALELAPLNDKVHSQLNRTRYQQRILNLSKGMIRSMGKRILAPIKSNLKS